ncbi:MAG TPA: 2-oxo acid dehydrogenase subunit E2, partial [Gaiellaceae bacterium]|nr:2-oxo acid dehydrogenase subunit E2 [Gaiellaceae bacterium]
MARPVRMPPLGETSDELRIVAWRKAVGDDVAVGEPLLEIETDKATLEVEAAVAGTLLRILHAEGETVRAGTVIAYVGAPGEEVAEEAPARPERVLAAPAVRRFAEEQGIDLAVVTGSGPDGRVERADVIAAITGRGAVPATPASRHRRALAERLARSTRIPQFSVGVTVDMTHAAAEIEGTPGLTYTHLLLRAVAWALREHPDVNRLWLEEGPGFCSLDRADVGLAVAAEETLLVVSIPEPDRLTPADLVEAVEQAAEAARAGRLLERHRAPVGVTLSNLGGIGVDRFTALLDPDQTAVLAVGAVTKRPAFV